MPESSIGAAASPPNQAAKTSDDWLTICAISIVAAVVDDVVHEGAGHGLTALATGASSGLLTTVAWSSTFDSRLVEAGGTLANLAAALVCWLLLVRFSRASMAVRYFLVIALAFNLFAGTGYFLFSGVTDFGDWAVVISGLHPHWLWRVALVAVGAAALLNPLGIQLLWQSALPASAGGQSGLLWLPDAIPRHAAPGGNEAFLRRNYPWVAAAAVLALVFVLVLGRGITLRR